MLIPGLHTCPEMCVDFSKGPLELRVAQRHDSHTRHLGVRLMISCTQERGVSCPELQVVMNSGQEFYARTGELRTHSARGDLARALDSRGRKQSHLAVCGASECPSPARTPRRAGRHEASATPPPLMSDLHTRLDANGHKSEISYSTQDRCNLNPGPV